MGFTEANGTLGEVFDVISKSDMVVLLISDAAQVRLLPSIFHTNAACRCWCCCCCSSPPPPRCGAAAAWVLLPVAAA